MYWGFITAEGVGQLIECQRRMDSKAYISILDKAAIYTISSFDLLFQQDNCPIRTSSEMARQVRCKHIKVTFIQPSSHHYRKCIEEKITSF